MENDKMPNFNTRIEEKLRNYPTSVQDIARRAIESARKLDAAKLATMLEVKVKHVDDF